MAEESFDNRADKPTHNCSFSAELVNYLGTLGVIPNEKVVLFM
jgi:hypothetical protein